MNKKFFMIIENGKLVGYGSKSVKRELEHGEVEITELQWRMISKVSINLDRLQMELDLLMEKFYKHSWEL